MNFLKAFTPAADIAPQLNSGCLFDIQTGRYFTGRHGDSILSGGLAHTTGIGGRGNSFKSLLTAFFLLRALDRYAESVCQVYDTEQSAQLARYQQLLQNIMQDSLKDMMLHASGRFQITNKVAYSGSAWYELLKEATEDRKKNYKRDAIKTPFIDFAGTVIEILSPILIGLDSFSMFSTASVLKIQDEKTIGESDRNTEYMRDGNAKTQLMMELSHEAPARGLYMVMSAHMGDDAGAALDPYAPKMKKLAFLKGNVKFKNVPEKFTFLTNNCWYVAGVDVLRNQTTKAPEFPRNSDDDLKGDTDLMIATLANLRGKGGVTGLPFEIIISQSEGVKVGLSEFYYLKTYDRFGISGNDRTYALDLCPDINLQRTTVRSKIDENPRLQRALEITSELAQMHNLWFHLPKDFLVTPKQLFDGLKAKGYDIDELLHTRGYWTFNHYDHPIRPLTTMDLLNMLAGKYRPFWMKPSEHTGFIATT